MQHCDPDVLALAALGEALSEHDTTHLAGCGDCRRDVDELAAAVAPLKVEVPAGPAVQPPPQVWQRIAAQTGVTVAPRNPAPAPPSSRDADVVPLPARAPSDPSAPFVPSTPFVPSNPFIPSRSVRRWGRGAVLAVAASALVVGAVGGSLVTRAVTGPNGGNGSTVVVAQVQLAALPLDPGANGKASIVRTGAGQRDLVVDVSRLEPRPGTFYEVWLIDTSVKKMVAVGILTGTEGRFTIPASVDVGQFPVVDISVQQPGDPRHSGNSVLRGTLPA